MSKCTETIEKSLSALPSKWRKQIAKSICASSLGSLFEFNCDDVKECETLTYLSEFTTNGTTVCISFTDEHSVKVTRCFNFSDILNNSIKDLDPKCLADAGDWVDLTYAQKFQLIVDKVCEDCQEIVEESTTSTSTTETTTAAPTTTTTSSSSTTTTETTLNLDDCTDYFVVNNTGDGVTVNYLRCGGGVFPHSVLPDGASGHYCAVTGTLSAEDDVTITEEGPCEL